MPIPSVEQFFALAGSSPWRWLTLRFRVTWHGRMHTPAAGFEREPVRAWVARPDALRVESLDGRVLIADRRPESAASTRVLASVDGARHAASGAQASAVHQAIGEPELDEFGLVRSRPYGLMPDDPMYENYHWVAMLDPRELADGVQGEPDVPPLVVGNLAEVDHHGRPVWEAVVRPTDTYDPRCACCALLFGAKSEAIVADLGGPTLSERDPSVRYADAFRVRVDVQTSVCVLTEEIGGSAPGSGHELVIEAADEQLPNELFEPPPHERWLRSRRR
jgi:hypothetical protein